MATLSIKLAPRVNAALQERATADGLDVSEYASELLARIVTESDNERMVRKLKGRKPNTDITTDMILDALQAGRK